MNITLKCTAKAARYKQQTITDLTFVAQSSQSQDSYIFMQQVLSKNFKQQLAYRFSHIATPIDLETYPIYRDQNYAFFRTNQTVLRVGSQFQTTKVIEHMSQDVKKLVDAVNSLQQYQSSSSQQTVIFSQSFS